MDDLETLTKKELVEYADEHHLPPLNMSEKKTDMIEKIQQALAQTSSTQIGIRLLNNVYHPQSGRLEAGIHVVPRQIADVLTESLTDSVVQVISAKEVAAYYGLGHGDTT